MLWSGDTKKNSSPTRPPHVFGNGPLFCIFRTDHWAISELATNKKLQHSLTQDKQRIIQFNKRMKELPKGDTLRKNLKVVPSRGEILLV
jgi:hypothetical protein